MSVREIWRALEADARSTSTGFLLRRIAGPHDLQLGIEKPSNRRMLNLRVRSSAVSADLEAVPKSAGFVVTTVREVSVKGFTSLQLVLGDQRYADIFVVLVEDVVTDVSRAGTDAEAVDSFVNRLARWQAFLKAHGPDGLSEERQRGLFGELWFLLNRLIPSLGIRISVEAWAGPQGAPQDFQLAARAIEVKVSTTKQLQTLRISSERQLDDVAPGHLLLLHLSIDVRSTGEETLKALVQAVRARIAVEPAVANRFEELLHFVGFLDVHGNRYSTASYSIREVNYFHVREGFPRIVESMVMSGVGDVVYSISVAACRPYQITDLAASTIIAGKSNGA